MEESLIFSDFSSGELPPVGSVVEKCFNSPTMEYFKVKILAHDERVAIFRWLEGNFSGRIDESDNRINHKGTSCECPTFRPIKSHKDKVIEKAREALKGFDLPPDVYEVLYITDCLKLPAP